MKKRDYKQEYEKYQGTKEQKRRRAYRNKIRRKLTKEGKVHKGDGKDIDHKDHNVANMDPSNVRVVDKEKNRSYKRRSDGTAKGASKEAHRSTGKKTKQRLGDV